MGGTKAGGLKAAKKNLAREPGFYSRIGAIGGRNGDSGGFAAYKPCYCSAVAGSHHKANCAGKKGGTISRRRKAG